MWQMVNQLDAWIAWQPLVGLALFAVLGAIIRRRYGIRTFASFGVVTLLTYTFLWLVLFPGAVFQRLDARTILFVLLATLFALLPVAVSMLLLTRRTKAGVMPLAALGVCVSVGLWLALPIVGLPLACAFLHDCM